MADVQVVTATMMQLWSEIIYYLQESGVDVTNLPIPATLDEMIKYAESIGLQVTEVYTVGRYQSGWAVVQAANASETTALANRTITDLSLSAGGEITSYTQGNKTFGLVARKIVVGALFAAMAIDVAVGSVQPYIQRLIDGLTPFTLDGENLPVIIDANGTSYLDHRAIEKFRSDLIELGFFEEQGAEVGIPYTYGYYGQQQGSYYTTALQNHLPYVTLTNNAIRFYQYVKGEDNLTGDLKYIKYASSFNDEGVAVNEFMIKFTINNDPFTVRAAYVIDPVSTTDRFYFQTFNSAGSFTGWNYYMGDTISFTVTVDGVTHSHILRRVIDGLTYDANTTNPDLPAYYEYTPDELGDLTGLINNNGDLNDVVVNMAIKQLYGIGNIEGVTIHNSTVGDQLESLTDIFPEWAQGLTIPTPTEDDYTATTEYLPVSLIQTDPFASDIIATENDRDGSTSNDVQNEILEKLLELYQELLRDPDNPNEVITPTIEVGDTGDTPPEAPTLVSGASNGLWTIYNPTLSEVQQFGGWLWSESIIDQIIRQFNNPIQAVIGFMTIYATPITGSRKIIKAGYLSSPVSALEVTNQYIEIDCGEVDVGEYYHTAVDYTKTKIDLFLPFIGIVPLSAGVVMGSTVSILYRIDVLTGTCLAQVKVSKQNSDAVLYTYAGNCAVQLPLTASTYTGMVGALLGLTSAVSSAMIGDMAGAIDSSIQGLTSGITNLSGTAKSGVLSSNAGALGIRIPYMIITHPTAYDALIYNQTYGYPSNIYERLSSLSGFVRVKDVHLKEIPCTDQELDMIYAKLREGIIIS